MCVIKIVLKIHKCKMKIVFVEDFMDDNPKEIILDNSLIRCCISPLGATLCSVKLHSCMDKELTLALPSSKEYQNSDTYSGATLGPAAGRIRNGELWIHGEQYQLDQNEGKTTLHGGRHNLSHKLFEVREQQNDFVKLTVCLNDGEDGWPGNRIVTVIYSIGPGMCLHIQYEASSDRATYFDLSNHTYWNLNGTVGSDSLDESLMIDADEVLYNDADHLPIGRFKVENTAFDYRQLCTIANQITKYAEDIQLKNAHGYNNAYILNDRDYWNVPAVILKSNLSGITMNLYTDQNTVVMYSGGYLNHEIALADGASGSPGCAIALEAQNWPDACHIKEAPFQITEPGQQYKKNIIVSFSKS